MIDDTSMTLCDEYIYQDANHAFDIISSFSYRTFFLIYYRTPGATGERLTDRDTSYVKVFCICAPLRDLNKVSSLTAQLIMDNE
jgi:hypothetical protein